MVLRKQSELQGGSIMPQVTVWVETAAWPGDLKYDSGQT